MAEHNEALQRALWKDNTERLQALIQPVNQPKYATDVCWSDLEWVLARYQKDWGGMDLCPDFQRGHVWTSGQQQAYVEAILRGAASSSALHIQFNCPNWENDNYAGDLPLGFQCIDGLQRLTAVTKFLHGETRPFGLTPEDLKLSRFQIKNSFAFRFQVFCFEKKADVLSHYLDFNSGGVAHSPEEIDRVRRMRDQLCNSDEPPEHADLACTPK